MANFYKKLFSKAKQIKSGVGFIRENFPVGARSIGRKIVYHLAGGAYGKKMETRWQTPEGKKIQESLKSEGFLKTLKKSRRK